MSGVNEEGAKKERGKSFFIKTYGCQMNVYDSERMVDLLTPLGYARAETPDDADLVILNTCHIREKAAEKVYSELGRLKKLKTARRAEGGDMTIAVAGCVAQAEGAEMKARAPVVDMVMGPQAYHRLPQFLAETARAGGDVLETDFAVEEKFDVLAEARLEAGKSALKSPQEDASRGQKQAQGPAAFVTVQEGCDKFCTFCVVPYTRGPEVSRSVEAIVAEVRALAAAGVKEITLLGQNVNAWRAPSAQGSPAGGAKTWGLGELCRHLAMIGGVERIRFTTSHPRDMDDGLIAALGEEPKLMPYLHLPVQAGADRVLKAMNRGHDAEHYIRLIERIRAARPDIAISGDFIVGFPGETEADFEQTLALVETVGYASAYSFKYSRRPGTPGAGMAKQVAEPEKDARLVRLQRLLEDQRIAFNRAQIGRRLPVLLEKPGRHEGQLVGRSPYLQSVHVEAPESMLGSMVNAHIADASANALTGVLAGVLADVLISPDG